MTKDYRIFVVEDVNTARRLLKAMLENTCEVECFDAAEACLSRLPAQSPDLFLLDVGLPGMDGYELCRRIKANPSTAQTPVIFLSGHDAPEDVLAGYDAGGQDYIVKPFDMASLNRKIENLRRIAVERRALMGLAQASDALASLVMANLDEYTTLIKFLRTLNDCDNAVAVVEAILRVLAAAQLEGAVQIRLRDFEKTYSQSGENWPMEVSVINHVRTLGGLFEFKKRAAYNYEHITLLVTNMPLEEPDLYGRLRDNLAMAVESANAKLSALQAFTDNAAMHEEISALLAGIGDTLNAFGKRVDAARYQGTEFTSRFLDDLLSALAQFGLTAEQEEQLLELARQRAEQLAKIYDIAGQTQEALTQLSARLTQILGTAR